MLSKQARANLIASLTTAENTEVIEQLLTDVNELTQTLETCGTLTEAGEVSTFAANVNADDGYKQKFEDLQKKYVDRFMNGSSDPAADPEPPAADPAADPEPHDDETKIADLFESEKESVD